MPAWEAGSKIQVCFNRFNGGKRVIADKKLFIVLEGLDGSGKTTQARLLVDNLKKRGIDAVCLKEPTDGVWGKKIREIAATGRDHVAPEEELDYFIKDREEDARLNIIPALKAGRVVVMDRYIYSNMAYQGALGIDPALIREKNAHFPQPDVVFFLDVPPQEGIGRIKSGREGGANAGFEKSDYLKKVYEIFRRDEFDFMIRTDACKEIGEIQEQILQKVLSLLKP